MKSIKARIQGFAVLPLLVVVFLLAISALGTYIVVNQGTSGYGSRASVNNSAITTVSRTVNGTTFSCKRIDCDKWVNISSSEPRGSSCRSAVDSGSLSVCKWVNTYGVIDGGTDQCDVSNEYRGGALQKERLSQSIVSTYNESSEDVAFFNCTQTSVPTTCNVGYDQQCGPGKCAGGGTANCISPNVCYNGLCKAATYTPGPSNPKPTVTPTPQQSGGGGSCQAGYTSVVTTCAKAASSDVPCAIGYHKINNQCVKAAASEVPCATGYIKVGGCVPIPASNAPCSTSQVNVNGTCVNKSSTVVATTTPTNPKPTSTPVPGGGGGGPIDYGQGNGSCAATFAGATCQDTSSCAGTVHSGYCPGPATWKCCAPAGGGGGGGGAVTPSPSAKGLPPTCEIKGKKSIKAGEVVEYTATCADVDGNLNKIELYWSKKGGDWNIFKTCSQNASGTGTCTSSFTFTEPGTYFIVANGYDANGLKCTGYSWRPIPADWAICSENDTIVADVGGDVTLNLTVRLQGVTAQPSGGQTVPFKAKIKGPTESDDVSGTFTANSAGKWTGSVTFSNVIVGSDTKYTIYIKAGKHLQKRVCAFAPTEASGGLYNCTDGAIPLTKGANNLDFSGIMLLAGDLPSSTGEQNGIVDSYDISYVLNHLGSTVESELAIGDLNFDGVIDTQDRSLIIQSLNVKYDDQ